LTNTNFSHIKTTEKPYIRYFAQDTPDAKKLEELIKNKKIDPDGDIPFAYYASLQRY
jgi:hypothetical protein